MATFGLGGFFYEFKVEGGSAHFHFYDQDDASNTADTSVAAKDFPEGVQAANDRGVAEQAFALVSKQLNDKRDERLKKEAADELDKRTEEDRRVREGAAEFIANSSDQGDQTGVITTGEDKPEDSKKK